MVRTFVALLIPEPWIEYLAAVERDLKPLTSGLSWVKPENLHLTVRFLGDLGDSGVRRAGAAVTRGAAEAPAIRASIGGLGAFPNAHRPRVLWAGLGEGAEESKGVARSINDCLKQDGFGPADKPFKPHLTLARVREGATGLDSFRAYRLPRAPASGWLDRVVLMKSDLHPTGSRYTPLLEIRLRKPEL